jgi:hypothetical protein
VIDWPLGILESTWEDIPIPECLLHITEEEFHLYSGLIFTCIDRTQVESNTKINKLFYVLACRDWALDYFATHLGSEVL